MKNEDYFIFLFDKNHYDSEDVNSLNYGTAYSLYSDDNENVKLYIFSSLEIKNDFISSKCIKKQYHITVF